MIVIGEREVDVSEEVLSHRHRLPDGGEGATVEVAVIAVVIVVALVVFED